jgi:copper chaperone
MHPENFEAIPLKKTLDLPTWESCTITSSTFQRSIPMCSSHQHSNDQATTAAATGAGISVRVDDMTCGHCAGTIKNAIESTIPGSKVTANPEAKLVSVEGTSDLAQINSIITLAGYTPAPAHS